MDGDTAAEAAARLLDGWAERTRREVPPGARIFDAHTHLGTDIGGIVGRLEAMIASMDRYGVSRANVFCLDEPDREPAFRAGNDRTLAFAAREPDRLVPFARLDLEQEPVTEALRCIERGARGIKLHPRAQRFGLGDERLEPVFALAAERRVPILIHAGLGMPPIATELHRLAERYPEAQLIVAHAGIADMAGLADRLSGRPGVFFDTSTWSAVDLLDLYSRVPSEQIVYASDAPYGQLPGFLLLMLRTARASGLDEDQLRDVLAGNAGRIADGEPPRPPTAIRARRRIELPLTLVRVHDYVTMLLPLLWSALPDRLGLLDLAINACREQLDDVPAAEIAQIAELLEVSRAMWSQLPSLSQEEQRPAARRVFRLIHLADILAVTAAP